MSRYTDLIVMDLQAEYVVASTEAELERNVQAALDSIALARVVTAILLAGPGQGGAFSVMIEHGSAGVGFVPDAIEARFYFAQIPAELGGRRSAASGRATASLELKDSDFAATSDGAVTAGMLLYGTDSAERNTYTSQSDWYIDADNGDDSNDGATAGTALETHAEFARRLGTDPVIDSAVTVNILTDLPEVLELEASFLGQSAYIHYLGSVTVLASDTASAWTAFNVNVEGQLTGTAITDFSTYLGRRVQITSGARAGWYTFISAIASTAVSDEIARVGAITAITGSPITREDVDVAAGVGAAGETFQIEQLPIVQGLQLRAHRLDTGGAVSGHPLTFLVDGLHVFNPRGAGQQETAIVMDCDFATDEPYIMLYRSGFGNFDFTKVSGRALSVIGCTTADVAGGDADEGAELFGMYVDIQGHCGGPMRFNNCVLVPQRTQSHFTNNYFDTLDNIAAAEFIGGTRMWMTMGPAGGSRGIDFGVYVDSTTEAVLVGISSMVGFDDVWGAQAGAGGGFRIDGRAIYDTVGEISTLTVGAGSDTVIGGVNVAYGALPSITAANNAMFVAEW